ncbi:MAG TPA: M55 family metallopeptidase [Thermomicrobiales bacterium]|nr:M55 family metallopeptidase [Thermomicrobiales bacterium]
MKVLISADMEGTCGVSSWVHVTPPEGSGSQPTSQTEYNRARSRMTAEVNAAIEGALSGGADEVIVNDSHDGQRNLIPEELHPSCRFISGSDKPLSMMQGVDLEGIGCAFFTGYHAKAGTPGGPLAHTWTGWVNDVRFNGLSTGEFGLNAAIAGTFGVPVTLVAGDEKAVAQTISLLGNKVVGVVVKEGFSTTSALHLHPLKAQGLIRAGAEQAVRNAAKAKPYVLPKKVVIEVEFEHQSRADQAERIPGIERAGERAIAFRPNDGVEMITLFKAAVRAASISFSP